MVPSFLPDGRSFLYTSLSDTRPVSIRMASTSGTTSRPILDNAILARYSGPGYLVFVRGTALFAQGFDWKRGTLQGEPFPISDSLNRGPGASASFATSANGTLVYRQQESVKPQLRIVDRAGGQVANIAGPLAYRPSSLAPDEKRVAAQLGGESGGDDFWLVDLSTSIVSRVTSEPGTEDPSVWTPDGKALVYGRSARVKSGIYRRPVGGGGEQQLLKGDQMLYPARITRDGTILYHNQQGKQLFLLPPGSQTATPVFATTTPRMPSTFLPMRNGSPTLPMSLTAGRSTSPDSPASPIAGRSPMAVASRGSGARMPRRSSTSLSMGA